MALALLLFHQIGGLAFNEGFLVGAALAVPVTLLVEHFVLRPMVRWHARLSRKPRAR